LIAAVKEHQKFRQLACYSIECLSKVIDPINRDYKKNLVVAHSCGAGKVVVDVLKRHPGKEDVLLVCCDCLHKLAADTANAEVIAEEGCVEAILASLEANPDISDDVLTVALSILDTLCNHSKALQTLVSRNAVASLISLLNVGSSQKTDVKIGCLKALTKLTKVQKGVDDFVQGGGIGPTIETMKSLVQNPLHAEAPELAALQAGCMLFSRLCSKDKSYIDVIKTAGGMELCLAIIEHCQDAQLCKICSKLLSTLCGSDSIDNVITSLKDQSSLSMEMQEHMLGLLSSLSMDSSSSTDIVRSGGVKVLVQSCEAKMSARQLETSTRTLLRIASSNTQSIRELVNDGAITALVGAITQPTQVSTIDPSTHKSSLEIKSNALQALTRITTVPDNVLLVCTANAIQPTLSVLSTDPDNLPLCWSAMNFLESLCGHGGVLEQYMQATDIDSMLGAINAHPHHEKLHLAALKIFSDLATNDDMLQAFIGRDLVEYVIGIIRSFSDNLPVLKESLYLLSTLLLSNGAMSRVLSAHDGMGLDIIMSAISNNIRQEDIRKVAAELIIQLSNDELISLVVAQLSEYAAIPTSDFTPEIMQKIPNIAMTIGALSMVPDNLGRIATSGGIAPIIILLSTMANVSVSDKNHAEALRTLCAALEEMIAYGDVLAHINVRSTIEACVLALQRHSKVTPVVISALRLLSAITALQENKQISVDCDVLSAVSAIVRVNATERSILEAVVSIFLNLSMADDDIALAICHHNASKMVIHCVKENLVDDIPTAECVMSLVSVLHRLATIPEGCEILRRQGCVACLFDALECFRSSEDVQQLCLSTIKIVLQKSDVTDTLNKLMKKVGDSKFFSLKDSSVEIVEKASLDIQRLGLLMLCGEDIVKQVEEIGGVTIIQNCLVGFSPSTNSNVCESVLISRARDEFVNFCIEALGRAALGNADINATIATVPLLVQAAQNNPTASVFNTIRTLSLLHPSVLEALARGGATAAALEVCHSGNYPTDVLAAAFNCLAALALDPTGLHAIVESNATSLVCDHISESLMSAEIGGDNVASIRSAVAVLLSLSKMVSGDGVNHAILRALSEVIEALCGLSRSFSGSKQGLYPDLLASTIDVVVSLLQGNHSDDYCSLLIDGGEISKIDHLMPSHDDTYLKFSRPTHALADMMCILAGKNESTCNYLQGLGTQDYLLRTMNYHPTDMPLQKKLASAVGALGMEGALSSLSSFIEQVVALVAGYSPDVIPQLSQYVQLIGNLMLFENALTLEVAENLLNTLLSACAALMLPVEGVQSERDEALHTCVTCVGKLLSLEWFVPSEDAIHRTLEFAMAMLRDCDAYQIQPDTKVAILRIVRGLVENTSNGGPYSLQMGLLNVLQQLTPGAALLSSTNSRRGSIGKSTSTVTAAVFTAEQNSTVDSLIQKLLQNLSLLSSLENNGVGELCDILCSQNAQTPGPMYWKNTLELLILEASFGYPYLLSVLAELYTPTRSTPRSAHITATISSTICEMLCQAINAGEVTSFNGSSHINAIVAATTKLLPHCPLELLDCLANTPEGSFAIVSSIELLQFTQDALCDSSTSVFASTIITKVASHELEGTMQTLVEYGVVKQILSALKGPGQEDEGFAQNAVYLLRVFADSIGIAELRLPKDTIRLMKDLMLRYASNEYLQNVAQSISDDLTNAFAIGPESQLEGHLAALIPIVAANGLWMQVFTEDSQPYYYNAADGNTQWEEPMEYKALRVELEDIVVLVDRLENNLTDVSVSQEVIDVIYGLLHSHASDNLIISQLMKFIYALSVKSSQTILQSLSSEYCQSLISSLQFQFSSSSVDISTLERALEMTEALCSIERFQAFLTGEEYIRVLCETCRAHAHHISVLIKGFSTLSTLAKSSPATATVCLQYGLHDIVVLATDKHLSNVTSEELEKLTKATAAKVRKHSSQSDQIVASTKSNPVILFYTILNLVGSVIVHEDAFLNHTICSMCVVSLLGILQTFSMETLFLNRVLRLLGAFSLDDNCVNVMIHKGVAKCVVSVLMTHVKTPLILKLGLELFSNLASLEPEENESEEYMTPIEILIHEGAVDFMVSVVKQHDDKPEIISTGVDAIYNAVDAESAPYIVRTGIIDCSFSALSRFDDDVSLTASVFQMLIVITSFGVGQVEVCGESGDRLVLLLQIMEANISNEEQVASVLQILLNAFSVKENRELLDNNGGVNTVFTVLAMYSENEAIVTLCISIMSVLSTSDALSQTIAERGCHKLMELVTTFIENTAVVARIFSLLGQLAFIKSNLKNIVQYGGVRIILDTMQVFGDDEELMISAIKTLDNVVSADVEYANIVIEKGGKAAIEKVQKMYPESHNEIHEAINSALLSMSARARAKGREGTKTNKGTLFARLNDVVDVEAAMKKEEVKTSKYDTSMPDPLTSQHRTLLRAGQMLTDFVKGTPSSKHMFLTTDCEYIILKDTSNKVSKPGRKVPLRNLKSVSKGYGPGHYKKTLVGGKKAAASEERSLYVSTVDGHSDDEITIEFSTTGDRNKWFDVLEALLLTASSCPHYLRAL